MTANTWAARSARRLERRFFLKALALGCSLPMAWKLSSMAVAQPAARPKRFMLFYMPHGVPPEHFNPKVNAMNPADFSLNETGVSILGPLQEKYKSLVNVHQGLKYPGAQTHQGIISFLSGVGTDGSGTIDEATPRTTVEHVIANGLNVKPLILGALNQEHAQYDQNSKLMWNGEYVVPEKNPVKAYDTVFAGIGSQPTTTGPDPDVELRAALSTLTEGEIVALQGELGNLTAEKTKLQLHLESVQALKAPGGGGTGPVSCTTRPSIAAVDSLRMKSQGQPTNDPNNDFFRKFENFPDILAAQLGIAAHALLCNVTPVVAVQALFANCEIDFAFMGSPGGHHNGLSHTGPNQVGASLDPGPRAPFAKAQRWFVEQLVQHVLTVLDQPDPADPMHKVIDNTIVYLCSEIGEGAWHTSDTRPIQLGAEIGAMSYVVSVSIGGGGGALKTGQVVSMAPDRPAGDLYLSLCRAMGVMDAKFGATTGPVTQVLV